MLRYAFPAAIAVTALAAPAQAATTITLHEQDNTATGVFTGAITTAGSFTREFTFDLSSAGRISLSIVTAAVNAASNIDFTSVTFNGNPFVLSPTGVVEFGYLANFGAVPGTQTLVVKGTSGRNAGFAGTVSFVPDRVPAVPEPATWAMLIFGFSLLGAAMRRRPANRAAVRAKIDFA